jgi:hypothetical protein
MQELYPYQDRMLFHFGQRAALINFPVLVFAQPFRTLAIPVVPPVPRAAAVRRIEA